MRNADEAALYYVYRVLQKWEMCRGGEPTVVAQLGKEYGPHFERVLHALSIGRPPAVGQVLLTEVDEVLGFFQQSGRFKEELEEYISGAGAKMAKLDGEVQISFSFSPYFDC
jgi:hypothetical protein